MKNGNVRVSECYLGGEPRVTVSFYTDNEIQIKLLGSRNRRGSKRLNSIFSGSGETVAFKKIFMPIDNLENILAAAVKMAKSAGSKCWVWDKCRIGIAKLHDEKLAVDNDMVEQFNDDLGF